MNEDDKTKADSLLTRREICSSVGSLDRRAHNLELNCQPDKAPSSQRRASEPSRSLVGRLVLKAQEFLRAECDRRIYLTRVVAELNLVHTGRKFLDDGADLYQAGMTSHASVSVMLALEDTFDIEFPESMLRKSTFESVSAISTALSTLVGSPVD